MPSSRYATPLTIYSRAGETFPGLVTEMFTNFEQILSRAHGNFEEKNKVLEPTVITRVGTLIVATIYLQLIQNRYMFRSFTVLQCSHQHCVQPVASDVEVVGYL